MAVVRPIIDQMGWEEWVNSRPEPVKAMCLSHPPDRLYRMEDGSGCRCTILSYHEAGTVSVAVTGEYNRVLFARRVFGVNPSVLVECDLPGPEEDVGDTSLEAGYSKEDIENILIPKLREAREKRIAESN